jgi:cell division protease FtsH
MKGQTYDYMGFLFDLDEATLQGLALTHLVGKDLRKADQLLDGFFLNVLMSVEIAGNPSLQFDVEHKAIRVEGDTRLRERLGSALRDVSIQVHLITQDPRVEAFIRSTLPVDTALYVVGSTGDMNTFQPNDVMLVDAIGWDGKGALPAPMGWDQQVVRTLVDSRVLQQQKPWLRSQCIAVHRYPPDGLCPRQDAAIEVLQDSIDLAKLSRLMERFRASHVRWKTHVALDVSFHGPVIRATLCLDGEERILDSRDLRKDIAWAEVPDLRMDDVLGLQSTKTRLMDYVSWLKDSRGAPGLRACILSGPPGTGKTHACLATAGEAGVPCKLLGSAEFQSMWHGESERIIRETFASLQGYEACVIIIDEFDGIAWRRDQSNEWHAESQASIVGELLRGIDRLSKGPGRVLLMGTTNQYGRIDPALLRSGRMGDHIYLGLPTALDRREMLDGLLEQNQLSIDLDEAVNLTTGCNPADLARLVAEARKLAAHEGADLSLEHLQESVFSLRRGETNTSLVMDKATRRRVAVHEAGHAILAYHLLGRDSLQHVSIIPTASGALGGTYSQASDLVTIMDRPTVECHLAVLLGGRAAEWLDQPETGASNGAEGDLHSATLLVHQAVGSWGLELEVPAVSLGALPLSLQSIMAPKVLGKITKWLEAAEARATAELTLHQSALLQLTERLLQAETLHRPELLAILDACAGHNLTVDLDPSP